VCLPDRVQHDHRPDVGVLDCRHFPGLLKRPMESLA
jgi:hypothetical protein